MRPDRRRLLSLLPLLAVLPACGDGRRAPAASGAVADVARNRGGASIRHLRRHIDSAPRTLDPTLNTEVPAQRILDDLFEGLVRPAPDGAVVPAVAARWDELDGGRRYVFELRAGARWSNGDPVTADDFVYAWRRLVDPRTASLSSQWAEPIRGALPIIKGEQPPESLGVRALGPARLEVELERPTPWFLYLTTNSFLMPLHRPTLEALGALWTRPGNMVCNGPFVLQSQFTNGAIRAVRNRQHPDSAALQLDEITYYPLSDRSAAISRFLAGDIDVVDSFPLDDVDWLRERLGPGVRTAPYFGTVMFGFDVSRPPFDSLPLRQALVMAIDREIIAEKLMHGLYLPAYHIVPPVAGYAAPVPGWSRLPRAARLARARELYAEAGYSARRPLEAELAVSIGGAEQRRLFEALSAMWRMNLGAEVAVAMEEFRVLTQNRFVGRHRFFWNAWIGDYPDPTTFLDLARRTNPQNHMRFADDRFESLLDEALATTEPAARARLYAAAESRLLDAAVMLPVYFYQSRHLLAAQLSGWDDNAMDRHLSRDLALSVPGA